MKDNLVTLAEYARLINTTPQYVSQLCAEPKINTQVIGGVKFIDISKYPPADFKKK